MKVVYDSAVPEGTFYFINTKMYRMVTWRRALPSVASIIASQRRRRRK